MNLRKKLRDAWSRQNKSTKPVSEIVQERYEKARQKEGLQFTLRRRRTWPFS